MKSHTRLSMAIGLIMLLLVSSSCGGSRAVSRANAQSLAASGFATVEHDVPTLVPTFTPTPRPTNTPPPSPTATAQSTSTPQPTATFTPTRPIASGPPDRIVAPTIGLDAEIVPIGWHQVTAADGSTYSEWDVASYAAGWHKNSALPGEIGNVVLSGHHNIEGEVFRYVVDLEPGDPISLYAGDQKFDYVVQQTMILEDKYVPYEQRTENARWIGPFPDERLTLVTCWPYNNNTHRVIVVAMPAEQP